MSNYNEDKKSIVHISGDEMSATIQLLPLMEDAIYERNEIIEILNANGVKVGIDNEVIDRIISEKRYYEKIVVAYGKQEENGQDGLFQFHFKTEPPKVSMINISVNYDDVPMFEMVEKDQLIITYTPATLGLFGFSVTGRLLKPKKGKDLPPIRGNGFRIAKDRCNYYANKKGKITYQNNMVSISDLHIVTGDLKVMDGPLYFDGDVKIYGNVLSGVLIKVTGSVEVMGNVESAVINAGKDIIIRKGMFGGKQGTLECAGSLHGSFFESVNIKAEQGIYANYLMNCLSGTNGKVEISGKKGAIIGGTTYGMRGIEAYTYGNMAELTTGLSTGYTEEILTEYMEFGKQIIRIRSEIDILISNKSKFEKQLRPEELMNHMLYEKILLALTVKEEELNHCFKRRTQLFEIINGNLKSAIIARGNVYPGVIVSIDAQNLRCSNCVKAVKFLSDGERVAAYELL